MPRKQPKKAKKATAKAPAKRAPRTKKTAEHPLTTCGAYRLVPNGDGTAHEELVPTPGA